VKKVQEAYFPGFEHLNREMEDLVTNFFGKGNGLLSAPARGWKPALDVFSSADELFIVMDIAGVDQGDFFISLEQQILRIRGIRKERSSEPQRSYQKLEMDFGPFQRLVQIPFPVQESEIKARYDNGILEIRLPLRLHTSTRLEIQTD